MGERFQGWQQRAHRTAQHSGRFVPDHALIKEGEIQETGDARDQIQCRNHGQSSPLLRCEWGDAMIGSNQIFGIFGRPAAHVNREVGEVDQR